jgi:hypothetical protein
MYRFDKAVFTLAQQMTTQPVMKTPLRLALALIALGSTSVWAADTMWISTLNQTWSINANWNSGSPPGASVGAILADSATVQHMINESSPAATLVQGFSFPLFSGGAGFDIYSASSPVGFSLRGGGTANGILNNDDNAQQFDIPLTLFSSSGLAGAGASQIFNAAAGGLIFSGVYSWNGSANTINNNGGTITLSGAYNTTIGLSTGRGDVAGLGGLVMASSGVLTLGGTIANSYGGNTILSAGLTTIAKVGAIPGNLVLNGGNLNLARLNQGMGTLSLSNSSTIDFTGATLASLVGPAGSNTVTFADSHSMNWNGQTLTILDWNPNEKLKFGSSGSALTAAQLNEIIFADLPYTPTGAILSDGTVIPVPEPSTAVLSLLGGGALAVGFVARRRKA